MKPIFLLIMLAFCAPAAFAQTDDHDHEAEAASGHDEAEHEAHGDHGEEQHDAHGEEEAQHAQFDSAQRTTAEITTVTAQRQALPQLITAPGEVVVNRYRTSVVTPRVDAQIVKRHVQLGDHVDAGQALVTLSSVAVATAQGALLEADTELRRVKQLGRDVVSEKRFVTAQVAYQQARAQVGAYGMSDRQIDELIRQGDAARADGRFQLLAPQSGTVINDPFVIGQIVAPGYELLRITDESRIWVEARLPVNEAEWIVKDVAATVTVGDTQLNGKVVQLHHQLDEVTRTRAVHIEVANPDHRLHPGQFVNAVIEGKAQQTQQGIVVPKAAVMRSKDGDWQVFVETAPGRFEAKEVALLRTAGERVMIDGIAPGTTVVAQGAFFVQSEIAKGGFEIHNH